MDKVNQGDLKDNFDLIPIERPGDPCSYAFCIPNQQAYARWPKFPAAARPTSGRAAAGRGLDPVQCEASALGEAIELASVCAWGDETLVTATLHELGPAALSPVDVNGFSARQLAERSQWNASPFAALDWRPPPFDATHPIDWMPATLSTGARCFVPADFVLVGRRQKNDAMAVSLATTSGCACGPTPDAARLRALLEVIERDAVGQWWYRPRPRPRIPLDMLDLPPALARYIEVRTRRTILLDLTTELGVPVTAAVSCQPDGKGIALGFGCAPNPVCAGRSAVTELFQTEIGLSQRAEQGDPLLDIWQHEATFDTLPVSDAVTPPADPAPGDLDALIARLMRYVKTCAFVDLTRPQFGRHVFRAVVPGMWSDKPRLAGFERLGTPEPRHFLPLLV